MNSRHRCAPAPIVLNHAVRPGQQLTSVLRGMNFSMPVRHRAIRHGTHNTNFKECMTLL